MPQLTVPWKREQERSQVCEKIYFKSIRQASGRTLKRKHTPTQLSGPASLWQNHWGNIPWHENFHLCIPNEHD
jgi:hypothetical protein